MFLIRIRFDLIFCSESDIFKQVQTSNISIFFFIENSFNFVAGIEFRSVQGIFFLLIIGALLSFLVAALEISFHWLVFIPPNNFLKFGNVVTEFHTLI